MEISVSRHRDRKMNIQFCSFYWSHARSPAVPPGAPLRPSCVLIALPCKRPMVALSPVVSPSLQPLLHPLPPPLSAGACDLRSVAFL